jgi:hypothetical protein
MTNEEVGIYTWEDAERHKRAYATAGVCCRCGDEIADGAPVWMVPCKLITPYCTISLTESTKAAACWKCTNTLFATNRAALRSGNCPACGRRVHHVLVGDQQRLVRFLCSDRCQNRIYGARFRARHPKPKKAVALVQCVVCQVNFPALRADAKTCSPACRQKAYRERERYRCGSR